MHEIQRYNIALIPASQSVNTALYREAERFKDRADGYCLEKNVALPHATLCQFMAAEKEALHILSLYETRHCPVNIQDLYANEGQEHRAGTSWIGYAVKPAPELLALQKEIYDTLKAQDLEVLTRTPEAYFPHFTLALVSASPPVKRAIPDTLNQTIECRIQLGLSDDNGQLLKIIQPHPPRGLKPMPTGN